MGYQADGSYKYEPLGNTHTSSPPPASTTIKDFVGGGFSGVLGILAALVAVANSGILQKLGEPFKTIGNWLVRLTGLLKGFGLASIATIGSVFKKKD